MVRVVSEGPECFVSISTNTDSNVVQNEFITLVTDCVIILFASHFVSGLSCSSVLQLAFWLLFILLDLLVKTISFPALETILFSDVSCGPVMLCCILLVVKKNRNRTAF